MAPRSEDEESSEGSDFGEVDQDILEGRDMASIAKYISSGECDKICIMAGAGISTSAGIPDFRSPETGLYANLERLNLPYPEAVFDISYFRKNPAPFYALARELEPGKFRPTPTHSFIRLLSEKGLLHTCFTQNIDTLERRAGVPAERLIEAHGSFATHSCIDCSAKYPDDKMKRAVETQEIPRCAECDGLVKPNIVFFGESLPEEFIFSLGTLESADLLIIMGTSLTVHPFASLTSIVPPSCPRILINLQRAGDIGRRPNDVVILQECDSAVWELCEELGWTEELKRLWDETDTAEGKKSKAEEEAEVRKEEGQGTTALIEGEADKEPDEDKSPVVIDVEGGGDSESIAVEESLHVDPTKDDKLREEVNALAASIEESLRVKHDDDVDDPEATPRGPNVGLTGKDDDGL